MHVVSAQPTGAPTVTPTQTTVFMVTNHDFSYQLGSNDSIIVLHRNKLSLLSVIKLSTKFGVAKLSAFLCCLCFCIDIFCLFNPLAHQGEHLRRPFDL